jgi:hypothetical protein
MIARDAQTGTLIFGVPDNHLYFDLWRNDRWIGMATGINEAEANQQAVDSLGAAHAVNLILTPFMGCGTSQATYKAQTGRDSLN